MTYAKTSIRVNHKFAEEWHVFTSVDLPGLLVASKRADIAFKDVGRAIEKLLFLNEGIKVTATAELTLKEFLELSQECDEEIVVEDKRFSLVRELAMA